MSVILEFEKMQGAGNDFVVWDNRQTNIPLNEIIELTPKLCNRKRGVGADGVLILQQSEIADYTMIYRNADGSNAGMCGNGGRCMALFAVKQGFPERHAFNVHENVYEAEVGENEVSLKFPVLVTPEKLNKLLGFELTKVDAATEHVVTLVEKSLLDEEDTLREVGKAIRSTTGLFPAGTNVNFVSVLGDHHIALQTFERGVENLTLACGTGAIASAIGHHYLNGLRTAENKIIVDCRGGQLKIDFRYDSADNNYHKIYLTGPADFVFKGTIAL